MSQTSDATLKKQGPVQTACNIGTATRDDGRSAHVHARGQANTQGMQEAQQGAATTQQRMSASTPPGSLASVPMASGALDAVTIGRDSAEEEGMPGLGTAAAGGKMYTTRRQRRRVVQWMGGVGNVCCVCSTPKPSSALAPRNQPTLSTETAAVGGARSQAPWTATLRTKTTHLRRSDDDNDDNNDADGPNHGSDPGGGGTGWETATSAGRMKSGGVTCQTCCHIIDASVSVDGQTCRRDSVDVGMGSRSKELLRSLRRLLVRDTAGDASSPRLKTHDETPTTTATTIITSAAAVQGSAGKRSQLGEFAVFQNHGGSNSSDNGTCTSSDRSAGTLAWLDDNNSSGGGGDGKGNRRGGKPVLDLDEKAARLRRAQKLLSKSAAG